MTHWFQKIFQDDILILEDLSRWPTHPRRILVLGHYLLGRVWLVSTGHFLHTIKMKSNEKKDNSGGQGEGWSQQWKSRLSDLWWCELLAPHCNWVVNCLQCSSNFPLNPLATGVHPFYCQPTCHNSLLIGWVQTSLRLVTVIIAFSRLPSHGSTGHSTRSTRGMCKL